MICAAYKPAYVYGGPTMSVSVLSEQLVRAGVSIEVYATTANGKEELPVTPGERVMVGDVPVTYFRRLTKDHSHFSPGMCKALFKTSPEFDIIHIHAWWNLVSLFSCLIALIRGVPVVVSPRGTLSPYSFQNKHIGPKWLIHHLLGKHLLNRSHLHLTSEREREAVRALVRPKSITVIPNFVDIPPLAFLPERRASGVFRLLFFSRIEEKKGLDLLIKSLPGLTFTYRLTIAGSGDEDYIALLKDLATELGVGTSVDWAGFQGADKFQLLQEHDLFVLPSYDENFGNTVIESLSVGTPVLISENVGLSDYIRDRKAGWICQAAPESIAAELNVIFGQRQEDLKRIRREAPGNIRADFKPENLVARYIEMYHTILSHG